MPSEFVFGYGALVALARPTRTFAEEGFVTDLRDFRRCWGVAMNNRVTVPGYKYYLDEDGRRPDLYVSFLDVKRAPGESVNGVCLPVTPERLHDLDRRERNYVRRDVTKHVDVPPQRVRVWTYVGSGAGRRRLAAGRAGGRAAVDRGYLEAVTQAFKALGPLEYERCAPSLDPGELPVLALDRHDLSTTITT
jgi:cation transport regulator ChaC